MKPQHDLPRWLTIGPLAFIVLCQFVAMFVPISITRFYTLEQDRWLIAAGLALAAAAAFRLPPSARPLGLSGRLVAGLALTVTVIAYAGHYLLLGGHDLTRDEQMANFDARIIGAGRLAWPLPPEWQASAKMLGMSFMPAVDRPAAWVSGYLPGNAALRALVGAIADPALTGPLLTGGSVIMVWLCARRLWKNEPEPAAVATLLVALSGQALLTGMTAYAMPAHLFFNQLWLWLFLVNRRGADFGALAVGAIATGLHQPVFHPLFVAPWMAVLMFRRDWGRLALFVAGYGLVALLWLAWPHWQTQAMMGPASSVAASGGGLLSKIAALLSGDNDRAPYMAANLLRFFSAQPVALLPLLFAGVAAARRNENAAALAGGIALTLAATAGLMPGQGHGFGYRYLHGLIGSAALMAGFGWRAVIPMTERLRPALIRSLIGGAIVLLPLQALYAQRFYAVYRDADRRIAQSGADYAIIGVVDAPYARDLVINRSDLSNRPLRLLAELAPPPAELARQLCRPGVTVALPQDRFYDPIDRLFGFAPAMTSSSRAASIGPAFAAAGCRVILLD